MQLESVNLFATFLMSLIIFLALDMVWLGWVAKDFYAKHLKGSLKVTVNWTVAGIFYLIFIAGLNYFVLLPALLDGSLVVAAVSGWLFGFVTYATYDLTNLATMKSWPKKVVIVDILWGSFLSMTVAVVTYNLYIGIFA